MSRLHRQKIRQQRRAAGLDAPPAALEVSEPVALKPARVKRPRRKAVKTATAKKAKRK